MDPSRHRLFYPYSTDYKPSLTFQQHTLCVLDPYLRTFQVITENKKGKILNCSEYGYRISVIQQTESSEGRLTLEIIKLYSHKVTFRLQLNLGVAQSAQASEWLRQIKKLMPEVIHLEEYLDISKVQKKLCYAYSNN